MSDYKARFLNLALAADALRFGSFTLKSGRTSPYFFNAGQFNTGGAMRELASCYVDAIEASGLSFDLVFGPAYKGIPLATAIACEFAARGRDLPLTFNRKEAKDHGEGGSLIGASLEGRRVLIVDDVITAGTAIREALAIIADGGGTVAGIAIALDRQEKPGGVEAPVEALSATQALHAEYGLPVVAVASLTDLLTFTSSDPRLSAHDAAMREYRARYGV